MKALQVLTQLVLRDLVKQKNLMLEFVGKAEEGIASLDNLPILLKQAQAKAKKLFQDTKARGVDLNNLSADEIKNHYQFSKEARNQKMSITKPKVDMAETVKSEVIDFKGWKPEVIEGGKGKEGVENLFQETKKVDLPEGVNWKDTPLPVNPKVESFYDELVENAYKESKKTGRDVKTIIEETIDYKFTGNETGKEILDIIEKKFFKADGGRIGFNQGGLGWDYEPMFTEKVEDFNVTEEVPSRIGQTFTDDTSQAFKVGNIASNTGITDPQKLLDLSKSKSQMQSFSMPGVWGKEMTSNDVLNKYAKQGLPSDYRHTLGTSAFKDSIIDYLGSNLGINKQSGILDTIGSIGAKGATLIEEGGDVFSALKQYYKDKQGTVGKNNPELFNLKLSEILAQPIEDVTANWFAADQIPFGTSPLEKLKMIQAYRKFGKDNYAQQLANQKKLEMQQKIAAEEARVAATKAIAAQNAQTYGTDDATGGYQSSWGGNQDFMSGSGTAADMGSFAHGGLASLWQR